MVASTVWSLNGVTGTWLAEDLSILILISETVAWVGADVVIERGVGVHRDFLGRLACGMS